MMSKILVFLFLINYTNAVISFNEINMIISNSLQVAQCISKCSKFNKDENMNDSADFNMQRSCMGMCMDSKMCR